jgi:preprotein translocase subunit SecG
MTAIILTIHLMIALALVIVVLLQRSEGGGLGIGGGGGGGMGSFMSARGTANLLAACFMSTSILLAILAGNTGTPSIVDRPAAVEKDPAKTEPAPPVSQ